MLPLRPDCSATFVTAAAVAATRALAIGRPRASAAMRVAFGGKLSEFCQRSFSCLETASRAKEEASEDDVDVAWSGIDIEAAALTIGMVGLA